MDPQKITNRVSKTPWTHTTRGHGGGSKCGCGFCKHFRLSGVLLPWGARETESPKKPLRDVGGKPLHPFPGLNLSYKAEDKVREERRFEVGVPLCRWLPPPPTPGPARCSVPPSFTPVLHFCSREPGGGCIRVGWGQDDRKGGGQACRSARTGPPGPLDAAPCWVPLPAVPQLPR